MITRIFDFTVAAIFIILTFPIWVIVALFIKLESSGPVFFKQERLGKNQKTFYIYKFRSMCLHEHTPQELGPVKHKHFLVTKTGYLLRRFKLDELPQLINILRGEMALVGPRPCLADRLPTMSPREKQRFSILPGLTGWAEVNGNVELDWHEQLLLDLWYIDHKTFRLDLIIIVKTIVTILRGHVKNLQAVHQAESYLRNNSNQTMDNKL